ncbi:MarR family transcriptional regulator [Bradyrhizobium sp. dw_78]|uniref:MarR family winged helix-turn-helix transcriptional regulator n=1 Tax=Bradyrhizobium sp. dw_78 TaxID=2719793 RepID=UPI001BD54E5F|nr:MarR family transcriptional regulator [Bradyrhizobium sp. dw_78]
MPKKISLSAKASRTKAQSPAPLFADTPLMERVGFLIRRLHQIHVALFVQEAGDLDITTIQFTALSILYQRGEIDQSELAVQVGMDRTNVSDVVRRLLERGYITVRVNPAHGRRRLIGLTGEGTTVLKMVDRRALCAHERTVAALAESDRKIFAVLLQRLVQEQNVSGRSPLRLK